MKRPLNAIIGVVLLLINGVMEPGFAHAASLQITLTPSTITFPDDDPDFVSSSQANSTVDFSVSTNGLGTGTYSCYAQALGNLVAGANSIPISNVSWTAVKNVGDPQVIFYNGALTTTVPGTLVMGGSGKDKPVDATLTFFIQNLWTYATGNYSQVVVFTLTTP